MGRANAKRTRKPRKGEREASGGAAGSVESRSTGTGRSTTAANVNEIRSAIDRQDTEINNLNLDIRSLDARRRELSAARNREQDRINQRFASGTAIREARQRQRELMNQTRTIDREIRDKVRSRNRVIAERDKNGKQLGLPPLVTDFNRRSLTDEIRRR